MLCDHVKSMLEEGVTTINLFTIWDAIRIAGHMCAGTAVACVRANEAATTESTMSPNTRTATGRAITQFIVYSILLHFKMKLPERMAFLFQWHGVYRRMMDMVNAFFSSRAS